MKNGVIWLSSSFLILASCATSSSISTSTSIVTSAPTSAPKSTPTSTSTSKPITTATTTTTATTGNWWNKLGTPQYGGAMTLRAPANFASWDPYSLGANASIFHCYLEPLFCTDWTMNPTVFNYQTNFCPPDYAKGELVESYEMPDQNTITVHLHHGIYWQNIPPLTAREMTADDVVYHFDRIYGLGDGFTKPAPLASMSVPWAQLKSVTATDKYTAVFTFQGANVETMLEGITSASVPTIEDPDAVKLWGNLDDWHHAIGTGPFILTDFVSGSSATLVKNPNFWAYDERYPQNKLPYVDSVLYLIIPDNATALAALRTGKIEVVDGLLAADAKNLNKTNPELLQVTYPPMAGHSLDLRNDLKPFNDIRVRQAMQMAIDLPTIAKTYYLGTVDPQPQTLTSEDLPGWGFTYNQWPQALKDQYAYNPTAAKQLLAAAGYPNDFNTNVVSQDIADQDLLQIVKSYLAAVGINMDIKIMDNTAWTNLVQVQKKYDQIAYKTTGRLGLDYPIMSAVPVFWTGAGGNWCMVSDPVYDAAYAKSVAISSTIADIKQALIDMDKEVAQQHYAISLLEPNLYGFYQPWFHGYNAQYGAISSGSSPGMTQSLYLARFWITPH